MSYSSGGGPMFGVPSSSEWMQMNGRARRPEEVRPRRSFREAVLAWLERQDREKSA